MLPLLSPRWSKPTANYDNLLQATLTLWQISTTELWVDTMFRGIAAVGVDQQPRDGFNPALALFYIAFIIVGGKAVTRTHDCLAEALKAAAEPHCCCEAGYQRPFISLTRIVLLRRMRMQASSSCSCLCL